jgi:hypothetical protein
MTRGFDKVLELLAVAPQPQLIQLPVGATDEQLEAQHGGLYGARPGDDLSFMDIGQRLT